MAAAPANAGIAATQTEFRKSALKLTQSMKSLSAGKGGWPQGGEGATENGRPAKPLTGNNSRDQVPATNALAAARTIQPYQYIGGPSAGRGRCNQKSTTPVRGR